MSLMREELDSLYKRLKNIQTRGLVFTVVRRFLAYSLKIIVIGSGLAVGSGLFKDYDPLLGFSSTVAFALDRVFSNLKRLVAEVAAGYAAKEQSLRIKSPFNRDAGVLQGKLRQGIIDQARFDTDYLPLCVTAHTALEEAIAKIEESLKISDIEALKDLALESKDKI